MICANGKLSHETKTLSDQDRFSLGFNNSIFFIRGREARVALFGMICRGNPLTCPCSIVGSILRPGPEEYMISIDYAVTDEFSLK